jgi:hypothetical protein
MNHGTLISHVDTDLVTRAQLLAVPTPEQTATFRPIPHIELVDMLDRVLNQQSIHIREEQFALRRDGAVLFGVLQLAYGETRLAIPSTSPRRLASTCTICVSTTRT